MSRDFTYVCEKDEEGSQRNEKCFPMSLLFGCGFKELFWKGLFFEKIGFFFMCGVCEEKV